MGRELDSRKDQGLALEEARGEGSQRRSVGRRVHAAGLVRAAGTETVTAWRTGLLLAVGGAAAVNWFICWTSLRNAFEQTVQTAHSRRRFVSIPCSAISLCVRAMRAESA